MRGVLSNPNGHNIFWWVIKTYEHVDDDNPLSKLSNWTFLNSILFGSVGFTNNSPTPFT